MSAIIESMVESLLEAHIIVYGKYYNHSDDDVLFKVSFQLYCDHEVHQ